MNPGDLTSVNIFVALLLVAGLAKGQVKYGWKWQWVAVTCAVVPILINLLAVGFVNVSGGNAVPIFDWNLAIVTAVRLILAGITFYILDKLDESIIAWLITVAIGALLIFPAIQAAATRLGI